MMARQEQPGGWRLNATPSKPSNGGKKAGWLKRAAYSFGGFRKQFTSERITEEEVGKQAWEKDRQDTASTTAGKFAIQTARH